MLLTLNIDWWITDGTVYVWVGQTVKMLILEGKKREYWWNHLIANLFLLYLQFYFHIKQCSNPKMKPWIWGKDER